MTEKFDYIAPACISPTRRIKEATVTDDCDDAASLSLVIQTKSELSVVITVAHPIPIESLKQHYVNQLEAWLTDNTIGLWLPWRVNKNQSAEPPRWAVYFTDLEDAAVFRMFVSGLYGKSEQMTQQSP